MARILVHLHLFYPDQTDYFIEKMKNIVNVAWDLVITFPKRDKVALQKIKNFKNDATFMEVENTGYDIWPFIKVLKNSALENYDYVIKLHTKRGYPKKRCPNEINFSWRDDLTDAILSSQQYFSNLINLLESNPDIGMVSSLKYFYKRDFYNDYVAKEMKNLGLSFKQGPTAMGAMFIARARVFNPLLQSGIDQNKFLDHSSCSGTNISMAHIYERILSHLPDNYGLIHKPVMPSISQYWKIKLKRGFEIIGRSFLCIERTGPARNKIIKICGIRVYRSKKGKYEADALKLKQLFNEN